jgi:exosortase/archaeosortase family protein
VIFIGSQRYVVEDACSGLTYVTLATFLGYAFGLLVYRSWMRILAIALLGGAIGIAANALRVNAIVLIDWWNGSQMDLGAHGTFQWIALFAALGILFYVLRRLEPDGAAIAPAQIAGLHSCRRTLIAPVVAGLLAVAASGCTAHLQAGETERSESARSDTFPTTISGWEFDGLAKRSVDWERGIEVAETIYGRHGRSLHLIAIEALSPSAKLPESRLAPEERPPWREKHTDRARGCPESRCTAFIHVTWERDKTHQVRHVYYVYALGAYVTDSRFVLRAMHGWHRLNGDAAATRLVGIVADDPLDPAELAHAFQRVASPARSGMAAY